MARSCADVEPYVNGVKQDITFGFGAADARNFDFENGPMSICRQLFMSLFYKNFKDLVRVSVKNGNVHLTVPSTLSTSPADIPSDDDMASAGSVEYAPIPEGPRLSDVSSLPKSDKGSVHQDSEEETESDFSAEQGVLLDLNKDAEEFADIAAALMRRVPQFSTSLQFRNLSTTVVLLGACRGILGEAPGISLRAYWSNFEDDADHMDVKIYMAALNIAGLAVPADFLERYNATPHRPTDTFERTVERTRALPRLGAGWRSLTDLWTLDWLCAYGST